MSVWNYREPEGGSSTLPLITFNPPSSYAFLLTLWVRNSPRCLYFKNTMVMPISIIQFTEPRHTVSTKRLSNIS